MVYNGGRFNKYFILNFVFSTGEKPDVIFNGGTIINMRLPTYDIVFRDTYLYISRALSALPKMFWY